MNEYEMLKARVRELESGMKAHARFMEQFTMVVYFVAGVVLAAFFNLHWLWLLAGLYMIWQVGKFIVMAIRETIAARRVRKAESAKLLAAWDAAVFKKPHK